MKEAASYALLFLCFTDRLRKHQHENRPFSFFAFHMNITVMPFRKCIAKP